MGVHAECICCWVHNKRGDSRGVELQLQRRKRNRRPIHGIHHQKPYLSRFGWLRIRFRLWKRSSKLWRRSSCPTLLMAPAHDVGLPMDATNSIPQMSHTFVNDDSDINSFDGSGSWCKVYFLFFKFLSFFSQGRSNNFFLMYSF